MKGFKEIFFSFVVGLLSLYSLARVNVSMKEQRATPPPQPQTVTGRPADSKLAVSWGIEAIEAHSLPRAKEDTPVVVAVIDTGCDINHPSLRQSLWLNSGETGIAEDGSDKASNGIDDDGNGYADDVHGWDFVSDSPALMDEHGHGTHIAGIIGSAPLDGLSGGGVAPRVSLMILKYYDTENSGAANLTHTINAIRYAVDNGAQIINYSGGGILRNRAEYEALAYAAEKGVLVVAAAGNEGVNSDFFPFYPAGYELPNIVSVAAVDRALQLLPVSNYGVGSVDIAAPGKNIYSTLPGGQYGYMTGTSQATAFVTGVAALMMASDRRWRDPAALRERLLGAGQSVANLKNRIGPGQMLNARAALAAPELELTQFSKSRSPAQNAN